MSNEISSLLLTIAGASASFVAILGGFIASKLIALNGERDVAESNLEEIRYQKFIKTQERDILRRSIDEEDSLSYIYEHMEELIDGFELDEVYEETEVQVVEYETLLEYWCEAQIYIEQFDECLEKENCRLNSDMIPCELAEENTNNPFGYEVLAMYAGYGFSDDVDDRPFRPRAKWYEKTKDKVMEANMQAAALDIQEQRYKLDLERAKKPRGMKVGLAVLALFSVFNIIAPLLLSMYEFSSKNSLIVAYCSIGTLTLGLGATFAYLVNMLKWKR